MAAVRLANLQQQVGIALPTELVDYILYLAETSDDTTPITATSATSAIVMNKAAIPPANCACPLLELPSEVRRFIFMDWLPSRDITIQPTCGIAPRPNFGGVTSRYSNNKLINLMVLNKKICHEVTEMVYEERFFGVHIHAGLQHAGVEWLNAGRQPLQYQDEITDARFSRFTQKDYFGFSRMKKIVINIYPCKENRHAALNTYFMSLALVNLLREGKPEDKDNCMTYVEIRLCHGMVKGAEDTSGASNHWWDPTTGSARESSVSGISDVQLALRPFAGLTGVQNVRIEMPRILENNRPTAKFADDLIKHMTNKERKCVIDNDAIGFQIETGRIALQDYINKTCFDGKWIDVPKLTDEELYEDSERLHDVSRDGDLRKFFPEKKKKHPHSPEKPWAGLGFKRLKSRSSVVVLRLRGEAGKARLEHMETKDEVARIERLMAVPLEDFGGMRYSRAHIRDRLKHIKSLKMKELKPRPARSDRPEDSRLLDWQRYAEETERSSQVLRYQDVIPGPRSSDEAAESASSLPRASGHRLKDLGRGIKMPSAINTAIAGFGRFRALERSSGLKDAPISISDDGDSDDGRACDEVVNSVDLDELEYAKRESVLAQDRDITCVACTLDVPNIVAQKFLTIYDGDVRKLLEVFGESLYPLERQVSPHPTSSPLLQRYGTTRRPVSVDFIAAASTLTTMTPSSAVITPTAAQAARAHWARQADAEDPFTTFDCGDTNNESLGTATGNDEYDINTLFDPTIW